MLMKKYSPIAIAVFLIGCSNSENNDGQVIEESLAGNWFTGCIEASSLPFPPGPAAFALNGYVTVELGFNNGNVIADGIMHGDSECSATDAPVRLFEGTYTIGNPTSSMTGVQVSSIHYVGDDGLFSISWDYETYFIIENGILYMDDLLTSEIDIRRDVPYSRNSM